MTTTASASPPCSVPAASIAHSNGPCGVPVPDCLSGKALPQLGRNRYMDPPTASERSFYERYSATAGSRKKGGRRRRAAGGSKKRLTAAARRRSLRRTNTKKRGGGYFFDLSPCPVGGMPAVVSYPDV